jgi:lipopolysaccharide export system permease protein
MNDEPLRLKLSLIDKYILRELSSFFLFGVGLFTALGVAIGTLSDLIYKITEYHLPSIIALQIFVYKIPEYTAYALPISILLTTLIIYGRFSSNSETLAWQSVGISPYRLVIPAMFASLIVTVITLVLNEFIVPISNYQASFLQEPFLSETPIKLQSKDIFYPEYEQKFDSHENNQIRHLKKIYYAERFDGKNLLNLTILSWSENKLKQIVTAKSARWDRVTNSWQLKNGKINNLAIEMARSKTQKFTKIYLRLSPTLFKIVTQERSPEEMSLAQAQQYLALIRDTGKETEIKTFQVRIQQKLAFPFICTVFTLIGSALGVNTTTVDRARGFGFCVAIVFSYYFIAFGTGALGIVGILSPVTAAWLPNILGLLLGGWLLWGSAIDKYSETKT